MVPEFITNLLAKNGIGIFLSLFCAFLLLVAVLFGAKRRGAGAFVRLVTLVFAAIAAFVLAKFLAAGFDGSVLDSIRERLADNPTVGKYMEDNPALMDCVSALIRLLIAPILFWICYLVLKLLTWIVFVIVAAIFRTKKHPKTFGRLTGAAIGFVCGLVGVVVLVVPVLGYTDMAAQVMEALPAANETAESTETTEETTETTEETAATTNSAGTAKEISKGIDSLNKAPGASAIYKAGGSKLFDSLTTTKLNGQKVTLRVEMTGSLAILQDVQVLRAKPINEYGETETAAVKKLVGDFDTSVLLTNLGSGVLAGVSQSWLEGKDFMGISKPEFDENATIIVDGFLRVFSTSNAENIGGDLATFADIFALLGEHGLFVYFGDGADTQGLAQELTSSGLILEVYALLDANSRMAPVKASFTDLGVRVLMNKLGVTNDLLAEHEELMNDVSNALKTVAENSANEDGTINREALQTEIGSTLEAHSVDVDDSTVQLVSDAIAEEFTADELANLTIEDIAARLAERFSEVGTSEDLDKYLSEIPPEAMS